MAVEFTDGYIHAATAFFAIALTVSIPELYGVYLESVRCARMGCWGCRARPCTRRYCRAGCYQQRPEVVVPQAFLKATPMSFVSLVLSCALIAVLTSEPLWTTEQAFFLPDRVVLMISVTTLCGMQIAASIAQQLDYDAHLKNAPVATRAQWALRVAQRASVAGSLLLMIALLMPDPVLRHAIEFRLVVLGATALPACGLALYAIGQARAQHRPQNPDSSGVVAGAVSMAVCLLLLTAATAASSAFGNTERTDDAQTYGHYGELSTRVDTWFVVALSAWAGFQLSILYLYFAPPCPSCCRSYTPATTGFQRY